MIVGASGNVVGYLLQILHFWELRKIGLEEMDIELVYYTYKWHAVVRTVMNHQVP